jgi:putative ABC transport system substrate-binding protein
MDRRRFLLASLAGALGAPVAAEAQPERNRPRVAVLYSAASTAGISGPNPKNSTMQAFLEGMRELGWVDGQNITIERRSAEGRTDSFWRRKWWTLKWTSWSSWERRRSSWRRTRRPVPSRS